MKQLLFCIFGFFAIHAQNQADFIIFSFDRPMQLYALLESSSVFISGLRDVFVVYRSSGDDFQSGYEIVKQSFPQVHYLKQRKDAKDFKQLTLKAFNASTAEYILFGVDDIIVKDDIDLHHAISAMEQYNAYGCFLRLSPYINYLYSWNRAQSIPPLQDVGDGFIWRFNQASQISDWGYPHTVDMTVYRKKDIKDDMNRLGYYNPNSLESMWAGVTSKIRGRQGFCYATSKIVNLPLNVVQTQFGNSNMKRKDLSPKTLLQCFLDGKKIDLWPLYQIQNRSAHMEYEPTFIQR
ncbi:MAG: hypothetical protein WD055_02615 [Candidatus Dependentiae bacterium]